MSSHSSTAISDLRTRYRMIARWLHRRGMAWSGTSEQLYSELCEAQIEPLFADADDLSAFIVANREGLRRLGIEARVRDSDEGTTIIDLRSSIAELRNCEVENNSLEERAGVKEADVDRGAAVDDPESGSADIESLRSRLNNTNGENGFEKRNRARRTASLGVAATAAAVTVLLVLVFPLRRQFARSLPAEVAPTNLERVINATTEEGTRARSEIGQARWNGSDALKRIDLGALRRAADQERRPSAQRELGMRYVEGRGVRQDKVVAYSWLVRAKANGDLSSEPVLREMTHELSPAELQRIRVTLGRAYLDGVGVVKDPVAAHTWFTLAELAGSSEGLRLKKKLEAEMTPEQISEANSKTNAWLKRQ
jgi:hypothetical protein